MSSLGRKNSWLNPTVVFINFHQTPSFPSSTPTLAPHNPSTMASNVQIISACAVSLVTGLLLGQYFGSAPSKPHTSKRKDQKRNITSPSNSPSSEAQSVGPSDVSDDLDYTSSSDPEESEEEDYEVDSTSLNDVPGETRMALIVRTDLKMTKGKAAAQCAHAALGCYRLMLQEGAASHNPQMLQRWERTGQAKITLQVPSKEDMDLLFAMAISMNVNSYIVHDAGRTQIEAGSATVLGLGPAPKMVLDQITGDLKLY